MTGEQNVITEDDGKGMPRIVAGVHGTPASDAALDWAVREARLRHAQLQLVLARDPTFGRSTRSWGQHLGPRRLSGPSASTCSEPSPHLPVTRRGWLARGDAPPQGVSLAINVTAGRIWRGSPNVGDSNSP